MQDTGHVRFKRREIRRHRVDLGAIFGDLLHSHQQLGLHLDFLGAADLFDHSLFKSPPPLTFHFKRPWLSTLIFLLDKPLDIGLFQTLVLSLELFHCFSVVSPCMMLLVTWPMSTIQMLTSGLGVVTHICNLE
jgi:hypothetical protein